MATNRTSAIQINEEIDLDEFEVATKIFSCPDLWAEMFRRLDGEDYRLNKAPMYREIFRRFSNENGIKRNVKVVLKCARKVWKTETAISLILWAAFNIPRFDILYICPVLKQTRKVFDNRLRNAIMSLKDKNYKERTILVSSEKIVIDFPEHECRNFIYGSSAFRDARSIIGDEVDLVILDEFQSSLIGKEIMEEVIKQSKFKWMLVCGTARNKDDPLDKIWQQSTQAEWDYEKNVWIHKYPRDIKRPFFGYHLSQLGHPYHDQDLIEKQRATWPPREFYNEILGEIYTGTVKPLTIEDFIGCYDSSFSLGEKTLFGERTFMGIDWGTHKHHWVIWSESKRLVNFGTINNAKTVEDIETIKQIITFYGPDIIIADANFGERECNELQAYYNHDFDKFRRCRYVNRREEYFVYKRVDKLGNPIFEYQVDKTRVIDEFIQLVNNGRIKIPFKTDTDRDRVFEFIEQCCNIKSDIEEKRDGKGAYIAAPRVKYMKDGPDHFLHASIYALLPVTTRKTVEEFEISYVDF